jgi:hypothetical protein
MKAPMIKGKKQTIWATILDRHLPKKRKEFDEKLPIHRLELRKAKGNDQKNFQGESMAN